MPAEAQANVPAGFSAKVASAARFAIHRLVHDLPEVYAKFPSYNSKIVSLSRGQSATLNKRLREQKNMFQMATMFHGKKILDGSECKLVGDVLFLHLRNWIVTVSVAEAGRRYSEGFRDGRKNSLILQRFRNPADIFYLSGFFLTCNLDRRAFSMHEFWNWIDDLERNIKENAGVWKAVPTPKEITVMQEVEFLIRRIKSRAGLRAAMDAIAERIALQQAAEDEKNKTEVEVNPGGRPVLPRRAKRVHHLDSSRSPKKSRTAEPTLSMTSSANSMPCSSLTLHSPITRTSKIDSATLPSSSQTDLSTVTSISSASSVSPRSVVDRSKLWKRRASKMLEVHFPELWPLKPLTPMVKCNDSDDNTQTAPIDTIEAMDVSEGEELDSEMFPVCAKCHNEIDDPEEDPAIECTECHLLYHMECQLVYRSQSKSDWKCWECAERMF